MTEEAEKTNDAPSEEPTEAIANALVFTGDMGGRLLFYPRDDRMLCVEATDGQHVLLMNLLDEKHVRQAHLYLGAWLETIRKNRDG